MQTFRLTGRAAAAKPISEWPEPGAARALARLRRQAVAEYARLEYLGRGEWLGQYGTSAAWKVREGDRQAEPLDEWARSLEEQVRDDER